MDVGLQKSALPILSLSTFLVSGISGGASTPAMPPAVNMGGATIRVGGSLVPTFQKWGNTGEKYIVYNLLYFNVPGHPACLATRRGEREAPVAPVSPRGPL